MGDEKKAALVFGANPMPGDVFYPRCRIPNKIEVAIVMKADEKDIHCIHVSSWPGSISIDDDMHFLPKKFWEKYHRVALY